MRALRHLSWALPLLCGAGLLSLDVAAPWVHSYDANGALFSTAARNYLRYGLRATRGGQVVNAGQLAPERFRFYAHHPPGLSLTIAASFALLGEAEWSARLVPVLFTLAAAALLYLVARRLAGPWAGLFATLVFVVQPMVVFYGRMPDHEAPAACFALLLTWLYLRWADRERGARWLGLLCGAAFVGVWYGWVVFVVPWLLVGYHWLARRRGWAWLLLPAGAATLASLSVVGHVAVVEGGLGELWGALAHRFGSQAGDRGVEGAFGLSDFLYRQYVYFMTCFSLGAGLVCLLYAGRWWRRGRATRLLLAALTAFGLLNVVGFRQGAYVHIYYQFYLAAPLALASGLVLEGFRAESATRRWKRWLLALALVVIVAESLAKLQWFAPEHPDFADQVRMADAVRGETHPGERVLVVWGLRSSFRQLVYYADRDITVASDRAAAARLALGGGFDRHIEVVVSEGYAPRALGIRPWAPSRPPRGPGR